MQKRYLERENARFIKPTGRPVGRPPKEKITVNGPVYTNSSAASSRRQNQSNAANGSVGGGQSHRKRGISTTIISRRESDDDGMNMLTTTQTAVPAASPVAVNPMVMSLEYTRIEQNSFSSKPAEHYCNKLFRQWSKDFDAEPLPQYFELTESQLLNPNLSVVIRRSMMNRVKNAAVIKRISGDKTLGTSKYGNFAKTDLPSGRYIMQYMGEIYQAKIYKNDKANQYSLLGTVKANVLMFPRSILALCSDARLMGSDARFIRRSCRPNCTLRLFVLGDVDRRPYFQAVRLGIFASRDINRGEELTLPWDWLPGHVCDSVNSKY